AERCHRINYISYGKLVATGTVPEVVAGAKLSTFVINGLGGADLIAIAERLRVAPGVDQVAPFGTTLHVVGRDAAVLETSVRAAAQAAAAKVAPAQTSLEDVFIQLMSKGQDNMA
ncbi:MAG: ABC transporter ATP-binding protein, partial [Paracoccaceae bacterium]|nr:ABC transporter ATP-binding protein [Paracoccaceae bacterium]